MALEDLNQRIQIRIDELTKGQKGKDDIVSPKDDNLYFLTEYTKIIQRYNLNHTIFDYKYGTLTDSELNLSCCTKAWLHIRYCLFDVSVIYWLLAIVPVASIGYVLF